MEDPLCGMRVTSVESMEDHGPHASETKGLSYHISVSGPAGVIQVLLVPVALRA
jgi:hypothetical protein